MLNAAFGGDIKMNTMEMVARMLGGFLEYHERPMLKKSFRLGSARRASHPWDNIQLSKGERRGKTYEQLQELRRKKYAEQQDQADFAEGAV